LFVIMLCIMESEVLLPQHSQCCVSVEGLKFITIACHLSYFNMYFVIQLPDKESQVKQLCYHFQ